MRKFDYLMCRLENELEDLKEVIEKGIACGFNAVDEKTGMSYWGLMEIKNGNVDMIKEILEQEYGAVGHIGTGSEDSPEIIVEEIKKAIKDLPK